MSASNQKFQPVIAISTDFELRNKPSGKKETTFLYQVYYQAIREAGGLPLLLPPCRSEELPTLKEIFDGLVLTGGDDLHPSLYGENPRDNLEMVHLERQNSDLELASFADSEGIPTLGICLGAQVLNVVRGGTLIQDIPSQRSEALPHKSEEGGKVFHKVEVLSPSRLESIVDKPEFSINSYHHQSIRTVGRGLRVNARASDGIIEGIEAYDHPFFMGFQWHLEMDREIHPFNRNILEAFVEAARKFSLKTRNLVS